MVTMDNACSTSIAKTQISYDTALSRARHPEYMTKAG
jgi:hypothetical protein